MVTEVAARSREEIAARVAADLAPGAVVNLGIGMPTLVAGHVPAGREVVFQSENGVVGTRPLEPGEHPDPDLINAGKEPIGLVAGGSYLSHADSFAMIRGGHVDVTVMGAFEVSAAGDLANWSSGTDAIPAVGGAMDLAAGAATVVTMMSHLTGAGAPKLVERCSLPLTAAGVVGRVYTDLAVLAVEGGEFVALELVPGLTFERLAAATAAALRDGRDRVPALLGERRR
ncbi:MAG TPA: 3-oxoacid CoA-transferase subunit B [Solirubrobacterales bacterium]|nr:3-oxoacid CoA-transferase subunit B [Solirubrobacterales bacterium]